MQPQKIEIKEEKTPEEVVSIVKSEGPAEVLEEKSEEKKSEPVLMKELPGLFPVELKKIQKLPRKISEKKPEEPKVDPIKIEEIAKTADEAKKTADAAMIGVKELDDRFKKVEKDLKDQQKQINEASKKADGSIPLWMIGVADLALALAAVYYSSDYAFNPVRANIATALCAVLTVTGIVLYIWRRNKAAKD